MTTYVFPGQGSQKVGMGGELFTAFPDLVSAADAILGYSVADLCASDDGRLNQTHYTQPALYVVNALNYLQKLQADDIKPHYVAGHSLGEYNALLAADVFDFATGLKLVHKRGELMNQARDGGMAAVIGLQDKQMQHVFQENNLSLLSVANYNTYKQLVITGPKNAIAQAAPIFQKIDGVRYIPLRVSGAFHSPLMADAQQSFAAFVAQFDFKAPKIPVIANVTAQPYPDNDIAKLLTAQITHSVKWVNSIEYLLAQGETEFAEIGPGRVLTGLLRKIRNKQ